MKLQILVEVDVSKTIAGTMQRSGFEFINTGSAIQIKVGNAPVIPQRKTKVIFVENPTQSIDEIGDSIANSSDKERLDDNGSKQ